MSDVVTDKKFKISIIISIYNVEDYLEEAILSIVNQSIGIDNIQLILVNDGSVDNSEDICLKFQDEYPDNIFYYKKKNGGLSSAKNCGLKYVKGELVNFFDSDDTLPLNTLESVYNFYKKHKNSIDVLTLPLVFFEAKTGLHPKYNYMGDKNRIINLLDEPYNFFLSGAASFYKLEKIKDFRFDESFHGEEDSLLNMTLLLKNPRFGYICENGVRYNYRKRFTQNSIVDTAKFNPESYKTVIKLLDRTIPDDNLYDFHKEFIAYELRSRISTISKKIFSDEEFDRILDRFRYYCKKLDADFIINRSVFLDSDFRKVQFLKLVGWDDQIRNVVLFNSICNIRRIKYNDGKVYLYINYSNYGCGELKFAAQISNKYIYPVLDKSFNGCFDRKKYDVLIDKSHYCIFEFDDKSKKVQFGFVDKNNFFYPVSKTNVGKYCLLRNDLRKVKYENVCVSLNNDIVTFKKEKSSILKLFINKCIDFLKILIKRKHFAFLRLFSSDKKKYILINDRLNVAGDNGEALFKYIYNYDKELSKITYFVISKKSNDYNRLKKIGKVVSTGSLKHKYLYLNSQYIYSSHMLLDFYSAFSNSNRKYYYDLCQYDFVWLQHGITQNDISGAANYLLKDNDYVIAATRSEYEEFTKDKYCYDNSQILLTGFARYDYLENDEKNIITISPTWRTWLTDIEKKDFLDSDYYKNYSNLLKDKDLYKKLKSKNIILEFVLHPEMLPFIDEFMKCENDYIKIISNPNYNQIFNTSKLLITDYSSVFFDFAYLKKPIIYFQFDHDEFFEKHYKPGYFSYKDNGFGDVLEDYKSVVKKITNYIDNGFKCEKKYIDRIEKTFVFLDKNNSKRILDSTYYKNR